MNPLAYHRPKIVSRAFSICSAVSQFGIHRRLSFSNLPTPFKMISFGLHCASWSYRLRIFIQLL